MQLSFLPLALPLAARTNLHDAAGKGDCELMEQSSASDLAPALANLPVRRRREGRIFGNS